MIKTERISIIQDLLSKKPIVSNEELVEALDISKATLYRDLRDFERMGLLRVVRGGITKNDSVVALANDDPYDAKNAVCFDEKRRIAEEAARLIKPNMTVVLDTGTTTYELCQEIIKIGNVQVITNDIHIADAFRMSTNINVFVIGGQLRKGYYTLVGIFEWASYFQHLSADITFLSCDAISLDRGIMISNSDEIAVKRRMMSLSKNHVLLCDHTKFDRTAFFSFAGLQEIDRIITDSGLSEETYQKYSSDDFYLDLV